MPVIRLNKVHLPVMLTELKTNQTILFKSPQVTIQCLFIQIVLMIALLLVIPWAHPSVNVHAVLENDSFGPRKANLVLIAYPSSEGSGAQSRQNLRCSLIQAVSQEEPSDRKPDP